MHFAYQPKTTYTREIIQPMQVLWQLSAAMLLAGCVYLPKLTPNEPSMALAAQSNSRIAQTIAALPESQERMVIIDQPHHALTSRIDLIDSADTSLDLQYFIWQNDSSGILVIKKLLAAADRGVRVRALLDDIQLEGLVNRLNALNAHPKIEIRIFNPFSVRWRYEMGIWRLTEFVIDGNRLNHRMHNKLLVADNQLAILGGRNIGDDYFGRSEQRNFVDLDILLCGSMITQLSDGFDQYWNSQWSQPVNQLFNLSVVPDDLARLRQRIQARLQHFPELQALSQTSTQGDSIVELSQGIPVISAEPIVDDPSVRWFDKPDELAKQLSDIALRAEKEVLIVTPYLIPTPALLAVGKQLLDRGVSIRIVTNSLETNDVVIAQAAYARYRQKIVDLGVDLFEMRGNATIDGERDETEISLHQKYMIIDRQNVFLGSVNLDPRSLYLNTELGMLVHSPDLAKALSQSFSTLTQPENTWHIVNTEQGVTWQAAEETLKRSPAKSLWQRVRYAFFSLLPVSQQI